MSRGDLVKTEMDSRCQFDERAYIIIYDLAPKMLKACIVRNNSYI